MDHGVIRKIDELGRITVPKDMRKKLRIKEDEFIELVLNDNSITLKKHLPLEMENSIYSHYAEAIHFETLKNVAISDRDKIVAVAGSDEFKNKYMGKSVSTHLDEIIQNRYIIKSEKGDNIVIAEGTEEKSRCVIVPICSDEDALGTIIICSRGDNEEIEDFIVKICTIAAKVLGNHSIK